MFQKTAASFDECSTAGVFLSTLHCEDYRSELLFPSDAQTLSAEPLELLPDLGWVEMTDLKSKYGARVIVQRVVCLRGMQLTLGHSYTPHMVSRPPRPSWNDLDHRATIKPCTSLGVPPPKKFFLN